MESNGGFVRISWMIYFGLLALGIITACITFYELSLPVIDAMGDEGQSRIEIRWGSFHLYSSVGILVLTGLLALSYQRVKPFHVAFILILTGAAYFLFFMTFTVGWVVAQGMLGFAVAVVVGVMLIVSRLVHMWVRLVKRNKG
ncbi:hypothetical protein DVB69_11505 [Sporosarcina sp. BI001-red]|uniref:hypothetical protein n=1 Tax=Sporosarcina sp. BI001-red TaxID=2282866 RepID=UPI000E277F26|nr:hypothetical protein [Sporosarcina sp. BI001-red]REB07445.1 hypothetical protein DVB69_11505 [Sporosarcina sp. BI001-red]